MKTLFPLLSIMFLLTVFTACTDDDQLLQPAAEDIPFLDGGFTLDKAVLSPASTNPDGTFKADVYLLGPAATLDVNGLSGFPADVMLFSFQALPERGVLPDGEYTFGLPSTGGTVLNNYIKDQLDITFEGLSFISSGTVTVGTSGEQRTFTLDVQVVNDINNQYDASVEGISLSGSVSVPLEVFE